MAFTRWPVAPSSTIHSFLMVIDCRCDCAATLQVKIIWRHDTRSCSTDLGKVSKASKAARKDGGCSVFLHPKNYQKKDMCFFLVN